MSDPPHHKTISIHEVRERSSTILGEGRYYFKGQSPEILISLRLTVQNSWPPLKCEPKKCNPSDSMKIVLPFLLSKQAKVRHADETIAIV